MQELTWTRRVGVRLVYPAMCAALSAMAVAGCGQSTGDRERVAKEQATAEASDVTAPTKNPDGCLEEYHEGVDYFPDKVEADYAQGWKVRYEDSYKVLTTTVDAGGGHAKAGGRVIEGTYVLLQCGAPEPTLTGELADAMVIEIPSKTLVDGGSVLYAAIEKLGIAEVLVGHAEPFFGKTEAPYLPKVAKRIDSGAVAEIGYEVNYEALAEADPDFYTNYAGDDAMFAQIKELGIPTVFYFPYTESPLGAAEQLEFLALFFNLEAKATALFEPVERRYLELRDRVRAEAGNVDQQPKVAIGVVDEGGDVTTRENQRFEPQLVREAGGVPVPDIDGGGIATVSMEQFLDGGADTDFWMDLTFFPSHKTGADYVAADSRLRGFRPLQGSGTFHRVGKRGMDYFLHGAIDVDRTLADLVSILHPELAPDHDLEFFARIR